MPLLFYFLMTAIAVDSGSLVMKDGTRATVAIADTAGCFIVVRSGYGNVRIDKRQVALLTFGNDTVRYGQGKCRDDGVSKVNLSVDSAIKRAMAGYAVKKSAAALNGGIAYCKRPLIRTTGGDDSSIASFSQKMVAFLARRGPVRSLSKEGLFFYLSRATDSAGNFRYLAFPAEISIRSTERKMSVSTFAKLDKSGNFVPPANGAFVGPSFKAVERETTVRFIVADLASNTIVFDERVHDSDKGLKDPDADTLDESRKNNGNNSILRIESTVEGLLKKQFK